MAIIYTDNRKNATLSRGIRNNNPMNLKKGEAWKGLAAGQNDATFCTFLDTRFGLRAGVIVILQQIRRGNNTIKKLLTAYAPASENDTNAYIQNVCKWTGSKPDDIIPLTHNYFFNLVRAIMQMENKAADLSAVKVYDLKQGINEGLAYFGIDTKNAFVFTTDENNAQGANKMPLPFDFVALIIVSFLLLISVR